MEYYLAIDIGASSGRHILGSIVDGKLVLEEIYRFENNVSKIDNHLTWDIDHLRKEVINGIKKCHEINKIPTTLAIDTWAVDYVLLDKQDQIIYPVYAYRDNRTEDVIDEVHKIYPFDKLYAHSGIQFQKFNTIYQFYADKKAGRLDKANTFLMIPEYLSFVLTGKKGHEYSNISTTGLLNAEDKTWNFDAIESLGLNKTLFTEIVEPGTLLGNFSKEIASEVGFDCKVILCASHDTASAVLSYPSEKDEVYLSSGTWSLIGTENKKPILSQISMEHNFTNEGGAYQTYRFLKNIMGLWMLQNVRREVSAKEGRKVSFPELIALAKTSSFEKIVDVNDDKFLAPKSMIEAVNSCFDHPLELKDVLSVIYHSLANEYKRAFAEIEEITGKKYDELYIIGGGSQDLHLSTLTKHYLGKKVFVGPTEATSIGNILVQLIADKKIKDIKQARKLVKDSFEIKEV